MVKGADTIFDTAIKVKPDFAVMDDEGALEKTYDFKFDDPQTGYIDDWQEKQMQEETYKKALPSGVEPEKVDNKTCQCDRTPGKPPKGMM